MNRVTEDTSVADIVRVCPGARRIFDRHGLKGCGGEHGPQEPLSFFASVHQVDVIALSNEINAEIEHPSVEQFLPAWRIGIRVRSF